VTPFRSVPEHVARNPIARAVSHKLLADAFRDFQINIYLMRDGELAGANVQACIQALSAFILATQRAGFGTHEAVSVMRGAKSALQQCSERHNKWRSLDAVAVDRGLQCAIDIYLQIPAVALTWAWQELQRQKEAA
jgi:hypothetical protein